MEGWTNIDLNRLRQIGWDIWNPIGLDDEWRANTPDEYDTYLWHVASMALRGISQDEAAAYLVRIASDNMGLSTAEPVAALATASAIAAYVESVR